MNNKSKKKRNISHFQFSSTKHYNKIIMLIKKNIWSILCPFNINFNLTYTGYTWVSEVSEMILKKKEFETFIIRPQSEKFDLIRFKHLKYQKEKNK